MLVVLVESECNTLYFRYLGFKTKVYTPSTLHIRKPWTRGTRESSISSNCFMALLKIVPKQFVDMDLTGVTMERMVFYIYFNL